MANGFDTILQLTTETLSSAEKERILIDFSRELGWEPSDRVYPEPDLESITSGHLVVEHGLEQSAVITFLKSPASYLEQQQITQILSISYNNLIDWHIYVEKDKVTYVFNRRYPLQPKSLPLARSNVANLQSTTFAQIVGDAPNPNFPALDDALVENISLWRRNLAAELNGKPQNSNYSALFNAIIFVRAAEDLAYRSDGRKDSILLSILKKHATKNEKTTISEIIEKALRKLIKSRLPKDFLELEKIKLFDSLSPAITYDLFSSFYKSHKVPYSYDFAIMSKHALSRIYEKYVSLLRFEEPGTQLSFLPSLPKEEYDKSYGSVYTPQFIARFFARFLYNRLPPLVFRKIKTIDPACGSSIFLRTILELQSVSNYNGISSEDVALLFRRVYGIDIEETAIQASKLSISLLYLVLMSGKLPKTLNVFAADALEYFLKHPDLCGDFDVVVANPPFVPHDLQNVFLRQNLTRVLGDLLIGKPDLYLAFLKMAVDMLKPGGYGLFVLPHVFLKNSSAASLRGYLHQQTWIHCLADLSAISVFNDRGSYVILIIFQKKDPQYIGSEPKATMIRCQEFVGHALQDYLSGNKKENQFYSIYDVDQETFADDEWMVLTPAESSVQSKLRRFSPLSEYLDVRQGVITGWDDVFIIQRNQIPKGEEKIWAPLLRDRDMQRFVTPKGSPYWVFYPIIEGKKLTQSDLERKFPRTWEYLLNHKSVLKARKSSRPNAWWEPTSPRSPEYLFRPKLVSPHLVLLPRFGLDETGRFAVSHGPYLTAKQPESELDFLKFYMGILNSSVGAWLISTHTDKYSRGYARLEVKTLGSIPVPNPAEIPARELAGLIRLVDKKLERSSDQGIDHQIDFLVSQIYELTVDEIKVMNFEGYNAKGYFATE